VEGVGVGKVVDPSTDGRIVEADIVGVAGSTGEGVGGRDGTAAATGLDVDVGVSIASRVGAGLGGREATKSGDVGVMVGVLVIGVVVSLASSRL
jgi:hypothetical protein